MILEFFHIDPKTIKEWQANRGFPKPKYIGRIGFYRAIELKLWQEKEWASATDKPPPRPELEKKKK